MAEQVFSDFSAGMNASGAVDKLDPKECLLAENVRLDEIGNVLSAGALSTQNSSPYAAAGGTNTNNVHSLFWNPSLGAVAGVGQDVFVGPTLGGMVSALAGSNPNLQKMSFGMGLSRVYFDLGNVGYWTNMRNLLTVDWPPPIAIGATITGPTSVGTASDTFVSPYGSSTWTNPNNLTSTNSLSFASFNYTGYPSDPRLIRATMSTNSFAISSTPVTGIQVTVVLSESVQIGQWQVALLKNGLPVGTIKPYVNSVQGVFQTATFGGSSDLWGATWAQADINSGSFGFQLWNAADTYPGILEAYGGQITVYQGAGITAGTGASGNLTGSYSYKITFVAMNGEESDASNPTNTVTLASQQGTLTALQTGDNRTVGRNIYRKGGALTSYYLVGTISDNVTTTYSDNQTDINALSQGTILAGDVPGDYPNTRFGPSTLALFPTYHYDRVFWINQVKKNQLIWSKPLNGFAYPVINSINVGDSKPITRIVSIFGELIIIKTDSIWRVTGTDESSFDLSQTPASVGTDWPFAVWPLPDKVMFANRWGLWVFNGYTAAPVTTKLDLWFRQDDRTGKSVFGVNGFHPPEVASATVPLRNEMVANAEKMYMAYAEVGQSQNNSILRMDLKTGAIAKRVASIPLSLAIDPVTGFVYEGDNAGFVSLLDDWNGSNQEGASANFDFQTSYFDLQRGSNKTIWALEFFLNTNGQNLTPTVYYDQGANSETLAAISASGLSRIVRPLESSNARKCQNFSVRLNGSINPIDSSGVPQIQIVHIKALFDIRTGRARTGQ